MLIAKKVLDKLLVEMEEIYSSWPYERDIALPSPGELKVLFIREGKLPGYHRIRVLETKGEEKAHVLVCIVYI